MRSDRGTKSTRRLVDRRGAATGVLLIAFLATTIGPVRAATTTPAKKKQAAPKAKPAARKPAPTKPAPTKPANDLRVAKIVERDGLRVFMGSTAKRDIPTNGDGKDIPSTVQSSNAFTLNLYRNVVASKEHAQKNVVLGPYTALFALGMTYGGARTKTADEMATVLGAKGIGSERWHNAINLYDLLLAKRLAGTPVEWRTANKVWVKRGLSLAADYADLATAKYGAPIAEADFAADAERERKVINDWTAQSTKDRIPELFAPGVITPATTIVLVNAVALDAPWQFPFPRSALGPFTTASGRVVQTPMMFFDDYLPSSTTSSYQAVEIPYSGGSLVMDLIVPNDLAAFEAALTPKRLDEVLGTIRDGGIHLSMPKFKTRSKEDLIPMLKTLGMRSAFGAADFSGFTGGPNGLFIDAVEHEAFIEVDENGTKAAAATGVAVVESHGPTIAVNRPFFYVIRDKSAGMILFVGRVLDPTQVS